MNSAIINSASIDYEHRTVTLVRDGLYDLTVPFSAFPDCGDFTTPNFNKFSIEDDGQTLKFGEYEASVDAVLYEFDEDYRKTHQWKI